MLKGSSGGITGKVSDESHVENTNYANAEAHECIYASRLNKIKEMPTGAPSPDLPPPVVDGGVAWWLVPYRRLAETS